MRYFVQEVGGDKVDVISLVQPGVCPDHFDVRPSIISEVNTASLIVYHGIEPWLDGLIEASDNRNVKKLFLSGPWGTPPLAIDKINSIKNALIEIDPQNKEYYKKNAEAISRELEELNQKILEDAKEHEVSNYKAIVMSWQAAFAQWIGLEIVNTYPPPETMSIQNVQNLVKIGKEEGVTFIIDNLQSGTSLGTQMAGEIGCRHIAFSNFPEAIPGTDTISEMIQYNADQLFISIQKLESESEEIALLKSEISSISNQLLIFQGLSGILLIITIALGVILYARKS